MEREADRNTAAPESEGLIELITRGGVHYRVSGDTPKEVLTNLIAAITLPASIKRDELLSAVLEREALMSTAVGHGISLPHPRNPLITDIHEQFVAIAFPKRNVDWSALDSAPVHTVILIVSASAKLHLRTLSQINFFCQQESFRALLENRASREEIIKVVGDAEKAW